ncbi:MAG: transglutaminase domain-containing protein [Dermatophilaceae bacterium]
MTVSEHPVERSAPSLATALRDGDRRRARRRARPETGEPRPRTALPTRDALVDAAFAAALVAVALVGLRTGFLGDRWAVVAGVGLSLGLLVGHLAAAWRWMAVTTLIVLTSVYFLLGGPVAVRGDLVAGVVPTAQTFTDLATWAVTGWKKWLTLLPPVDARGPVLALPWLAGLLGGALTLGVARRWASVPLTALTPVALLAGSIALGTLEPAARWVQGVGFAALLVSWLVIRAHRTRPPIQNGAGRGAQLATGAVLAALALVAGLVAGPVLPGTSAQERREVVRTRLVPPLDVSQFPSPLPGFRQFTEPNPAERYDATLLRVDGLPRGALLRFATLDSYDGLVWGAADRSRDGVPFQQVGSRVAPRGGGDTPVEVTVSIPADGYADYWLPTVGSPTRIEFTGPRSDELAEELWLNTDTDTAVVPRRLLGGEEYRMSALLPDPPAGTLPADLDVATGAIPPADAEFLDTRIDAWTGRVDGGPWQKLRAFAERMRVEGTYTDGGTPNSFEKVYLPGHTVARLTRFAASTKLAGNDEQYAAALALVAERLGIPARVVMGAEPQPDGTVRGKDVHAWVEVALDDGSWFPLARRTFLPSRDKTPDEQQSRIEDEKLGTQVPPPPGVNPPSVLQGPDQAQNATDLAKRKRSPLDISAWPWWLRLTVLGVALPVLLVLGWVVALARLKARRRRRHATTGQVPDRAAWVWRDLVAEARSLGVAVPPGGTRLEQSRAFPDDVCAGSVAAATDAVVFGPGTGDPDRVVVLAGDAEAARRSLRGRVSRWARWRSDADPRPLASRSRARIRPAGHWHGTATPVPSAPP